MTIGVSILGSTGSVGQTTLKVLRDDEVPRWGARKMSPHQNGFNDVLALATLHARMPEAIAAIGVQPVTLDDFGGSLTEPVRARLGEAIDLAARQLAAWGFPGRARAANESVEPLNSEVLQLAAYERGRPSEDNACRIGDPRLLATLSGER